MELCYKLLLFGSVKPHGCAAPRWKQMPLGTENPRSLPPHSQLCCQAAPFPWLPPHYYHRKSSEGWLRTWPAGPDTSRKGAGGKRCLHPMFHSAPAKPILPELWETAIGRLGSMGKHRNMAEIVSTGDTRTSITLTASGRTECYEFRIYQRKQGHK